MPPGDLEDDQVEYGDQEAEAGRKSEQKLLPNDRYHENLGHSHRESSKLMDKVGTHFLLPTEDDALAIRREKRKVIKPYSVRELLLIASIGVHDPNVTDAALNSVERDGLAVL